MGFLSRVPTVVTPRVGEISRGAGPTEDFWYQPWGWISSLATAGGFAISPEHALTLSHVHCAVSTISDDFGTMTCQMFRDLGDRGRDRVKYSDAGIGGLAYRIRWQPNRVQTAKAFWSTMAWQYLLRPACYAEILYRPGSDSIIDELLPRHPDRIEQQVLPSGRLRYKLTEPGGRPPRYVTQEEMFVVRNTSTDGLNAISRIQFGASALASALALQDFTRNYFKKGATAALLGTYKGEQMDEEQERSLHGSISRYMTGVENAGGFLLVPEDIGVTSLGVDPDKAQLLGLKNLSGRDVARMFKMPPSWLGIEGASAYKSQVQDAQDYVNRCQMPMTVEFEQAIYIHLIVARDYFAKFNMDYLLRADLKTRMQAYEIGIRSRILWPSEARAREDMNPDDELDALAAADHRAGSPRNGSSGSGDSGDEEARRRQSAVGAFNIRTTIIALGNAERVIRRERAAVERLAKKHPSDVEAWRDGLRSFFEDHAGFVAETMHLPMGIARAYAAQHGAALEGHGIGLMSEHWEREESEALTMLALDPPPERQAA